MWRIRVSVHGLPHVFLVHVIVERWLIIYFYTRTVHIQVGKAHMWCLKDGTSYKSSKNRRQKRLLFLNDWWTSVHTSSSLTCNVVVRIWNKSITVKYSLKFLIIVLAGRGVTIIFHVRGVAIKSGLLSYYTKKYLHGVVETLGDNDKLSDGRLILPAICTQVLATKIAVTNGFNMWFTPR